jgi:hypothetical protein
MKRRDKRRLVNALETMRQSPCLLCDGNPYVTGLFTAHRQAAVCAPPGKVRVVAYALCKTCYGTPNVQTKVEKIIFRQVPMAMAAPSN